MANDTLLPSCPPPFLNEADYPLTGGYLNGRSCGPSPLGDSIYCCLPCPIQAWVYSESFMSRIRQANYISFVSLLLCIFVLVSYLVLPASKSHRHYLNVGLLAAVIIYHFALVIPIFTTTDVCYNDITPRDMYSSATCAVTGSFLVFGGIGAVIWVFLRALWTHMRVCWDMSPGRPYMYISIASGIILPACFLAAVLSATGLSFRMGATCVPKHANSFADFWGWMLAFAGLTGAIQIATTGYCVMAYLRSLKRGRHAASMNKTSSTASRMSGDRGPRLPQVRPMREEEVGDSATKAEERMPKLSLRASTMSHRPMSSNLSSPISPLSPNTPQSPTTWRDVRALLLLQWRSICISIVVMLAIIFFTVVFIIQDAITSSKSGDTGDLPSVQQWTACLALTKGDADQCRRFTKDFVLPESTVLACLVVVALTGTGLAVLLIRMDMLRAWGALLRKLRRRRGHGGSEPDLPLTSLATMPYPGSAPNPSQGTQSTGQHVSSRLAPIAEALTTDDSRGHAQPTNNSASEPGARTSLMKRMSWRKSAFLERLNWPLPEEGLNQREDDSEQEAGNVKSGDDEDWKDIEIDNKSEQTERPFWENEEEDGAGVVLDPRAWRGGLAMNPVRAGQVSRQNSKAQRGGG